MISSRSSPMTGKREWPDDSIVSSSVSNGSSRSRTIIWERGTIMSRTWVSETSRTPWSIACSSLARRFRRRHSVRKPAMSSRPSASSPRRRVSRDHHPDLVLMLLLEGNSSGIDDPYLAVPVSGMQEISRRRRGYGFLNPNDLSSSTSLASMSWAFSPASWSKPSRCSAPWMQICAQWASSALS